VGYSPMTDRTKSTIIIAYVGALLFLLLVNTVGFWYTAIRAVSVPYQLDYGEGIVLYQASKINDLQLAYKPVDQYPYVVFHYPPLYHFVVRAVAPFTGSLIAAGRWVSVASGLLTELVIGILVFSCLPRRLQRSGRLATAVSAALLANVLDVMRWTSLARVDMLAILLSFIGVAVFVLSGKDKAWQYLAFVFFIAALFTKQSMVAAPLACLTAAALVDVRHATRLAVFAGIMGTTILGVLAWATRGGVINHLFLYNNNSFSLVRMIYEPLVNLRTIVPVAALALGYAAWVVAETAAQMHQKRWNRLKAGIECNGIRRLSVVCSFLLIYAILVSLTSGKNGSNYNYFIEWNLACCPLAALVVFRAVGCWPRERPWSPSLVMAGILPILMVSAGLPEAILRLHPVDPSAMQREEKSRAENYESIVSIIQRAQGPVLSEDMVLLVKAGKEVPAEPAILRELSSVGLWDERPFVKMIEEHRFPIIVVEDLSNWKRYTPTVARAISGAYSVTREFGTYRIYEPASTSR
jgi:hypothetical protein